MSTCADHDRGAVAGAPPPAPVPPRRRALPGNSGSFTTDGPEHDRGLRLRPDVHRQRPARRAGAGGRPGLCGRQGARPVRAGRVLREAVDGQGVRARAAAREHPDLVDADVRGRRPRVLAKRQRERERRQGQRLPAVDRPADRDRHHPRALDRARRPRHDDHLPGAHQPRARARRPGAADAAPAVVWHRHRHRRDRRHTGHEGRQGDAGADPPGRQVVGSGAARGRRHRRGARNWHPGEHRQPAGAKRQHHGAEHRGRPGQGPERRPADPLPRDRGPDLHLDQVRRRLEHRADPDRRPGGGGVRGRDAVAATAAAERERLGEPVARPDRCRRRPDARHRRQRVGVLPVVEHPSRPGLEHLPGRPVLQRLRRPHLLGRRDLDVPVAAGPAPRPRRRDGGPIATSACPRPSSTPPRPATRARGFRGRAR